MRTVRYPRWSNAKLTCACCRRLQVQPLNVLCLHGSRWFWCHVEDAEPFRAVIPATESGRLMLSRPKNKKFSVDLLSPIARKRTFGTIVHLLFWWLSWPGVQHHSHIQVVLLLPEFAFNLPRIIYLSQRELDIFQHVFLLFKQPISSGPSNMKEPVQLRLNKHDIFVQPLWKWAGWPWLS